ILGFCALVVCLLSLAPARPTGQLLPSVSEDLLAARRRGERMNVIVQGSDGAGSLRGHARGLLRRELQGALALEVSKDDFDALLKDPAVAHISRDIPVTSDMAVTNGVTAATAVWAGTSGLLSSTPGFKG